MHIISLSAGQLESCRGQEGFVTQLCCAGFWWCAAGSPVSVEPKLRCDVAASMTQMCGAERWAVRRGPLGLLAAPRASRGLESLAEASGSRRSSSSVQASDGRRQANLFPPRSSLPRRLPGTEPCPSKHGELRYQQPGKGWRRPQQKGQVREPA